MYTSFPLPFHSIFHIVENDPWDSSVGYGGLPNEEGDVELDSSVMHGPSRRAGAVASLRYIKNPSKVLKVGESVEVKVLKFDGETGRISLGMKQLKPDPWHDLPAHYPVGARVRGKVVSLNDYGAFVELEEGVEGLIHVSEMSWTKKVRHPSKIVSEGEMVDAVILGIDTEQQRISLGLKQLTPNPWEGLSSKHPIGSVVKGKVKSITDLGF